MRFNREARCTMESACRKMRLDDSQQRRDESIVVEVSGDERLRGGPCSPGASGPTGVAPVGEQLRGGLPVMSELLGHPRGIARQGASRPGGPGSARGRRAGRWLPTSIGEQAGRASGPPPLLDRASNPARLFLVLLTGGEQPSPGRGCSPGASTSYSMMMGSPGGDACQV